MDYQALALMLSAAPAPSGFVSSRMDLIEKEARVYTDEIRRTASGSLLVHRAGTGQKIALFTHIDDPGFLVTYQEDCGALRVNPLGTRDLPALLGVPLTSTRGVRGVLAKEDGVKAGDLKPEQLYLEAFGDTAIGDAFALSQPVTVIEDRLLGSGVTASLNAAILLDVLADLDVNADLTLVFTAHHLLGARDAAAAAALAAPDLAVTIDAYPAHDLPGGNDTNKLSGGPIVSHQARYAMSDPALVQLLLEAAGDRVQHDFAGPVQSDLSVIQKVGAGIPAAGVGYPARDIGTPAERALWKDAADVAAMLKQFLLLANR